MLASMKLPTKKLYIYIDIYTPVNVKVHYGDNPLQKYIGAVPKL